MRNAAPWIVYFVLAFGLSLVGVIDCARAAEELPGMLVVRFEAGTEALDQSAVRYAVERELGVTVKADGSPDAATLWVALAEHGELSLRYQPERSQLARTVPLSGADAAPALVARMAGNLVRDQAGVLVAQLAPVPAAPTPAPAPAAQPAKSVQPAAEPAEPESRPGKYQWPLSVAIGIPYGRDLGTVLTLAQAWRMDRLDLSLAVDLGMARVSGDIIIYGGGYEQVRVTTLDLTLWAGLDVRVLGGAAAYLQLGALAGYRMAGVKVPGNVSGSEGDLAIAARLTGFFRLVGKHGILLRSTFYIAPRQHVVSSSARIPGGDRVNGIVRTRAFPVGVQIGYQVTF